MYQNRKNGKNGERQKRRMAKMSKLFYYFPMLVQSCCFLPFSPFEEASCTRTPMQQEQRMYDLHDWTVF